MFPTAFQTRTLREKHNRNSEFASMEEVELSSINGREY